MPENTSDIEQHIERYRKLLERDPNSRVFAPLAEACRKANRLEEALAIARSGVGRHPTYASGRVALARAQLALGHYDEAAGELTEALAHAPENALAYRLLGEARVQLGDDAGAFDAFARALALNPEDDEAREALSRLEGAREEPPAAQAPAAPEADAGEGPEAAAPPLGASPEEATEEEAPASAEELDLDLEPVERPGGQPDAALADEDAPAAGASPAEVDSLEEASEAPLDGVASLEGAAEAYPEVGAGVADFGAAAITEEPPALEIPGEAEGPESAAVPDPRGGPAPEGEAEHDRIADADLDAAAEQAGFESAAAESLAGESPAEEAAEEQDVLEETLPGEPPFAGDSAEPAGASLAEAAMVPLSKRLDALDIAASSLAPEAREAVPAPGAASEAGGPEDDRPEQASGPAGEPPEQALPLDQRLEELADQYRRLGFPDRARALYSALLSGNPANLQAKRKLREIGPESGEPVRAPSTGNQEVRRKVEENVEVLNRWLANIRKGAAQ